MNQDDFSKLKLSAEQIACLHKVGTRTFAKLARETVEAIQYVAGLDEKGAKLLKKNAKFLAERGK